MWDHFRLRTRGIKSTKEEKKTEQVRSKNVTQIKEGARSDSHRPE